MVLSAGSNVDVKADRIAIDANELALMFAARAGSTANPTVYDVDNTAKFEADYITLKGSQGILSAMSSSTYGVRNSVEFTGLTQIEALARGDENNIFGEIGGGRAIDVMATDITFNSNAIIVGENLTYLGTRPGYQHPYEGWIDPYWLRTVSLTDRSKLVAHGNLSLSSNGGYYNTGLYLWKSEAELNGKTLITMQNGVDTTRAIYAWDGGSGTTKATFNDDLAISLADSDASYVAGIEAGAGGKVEVKKGLFLNDKHDATWSLISYGANSQIDVNSSETGTVQVSGDIGAINDGGISMVLNNANSYLTATSYTATSSSTSNGIVNLDLSRGAVWNMTGSSHVTDITLEGGIVNYLPPESNGIFKTLTVEGNFYGGGTLNINTSLGGDDSPTDKLIVEGDTSGNTLVAVNNIGGTGAQTVNGIEIVEVYGDSAGTFAKAGRIVAGAYDYDVVKKGSNWYLTNTFITDPVPDPIPDPGPTPDPTPQPEGEKTYRPESGSYLANILAANTLFNTRLHDRLGETQYTDALTGEQKVTSLWMRHIGGHNRFRDGSGQISTQSNRYVMQLGGDIAQWSTDGLDRWHLGLMAGYANSKSRSHSSLTGYTSRGEISGYSAGLYGTWYANDADKTGAYVDGWMLYNWFDNTVSGQGLASEKYDSDGITASLEAGYTFRLTESSNGRDSYWLQPKVQVTWM
ncbi:autotransporter outer membrane beta-barrel domain-containing protein, partial [Citrobacter sp. ku-bf4]|nr:autotransporter outer membrane beta-barrel domain-containing protein [Citrobacter sp. ku-bf4]MBS0828113.1 autotransporter outer membrane beta-barrel domain-containing protein [Citrobacter amalonaticus]